MWHKALGYVMNEIQTSIRGNENLKITPINEFYVKNSLK